MNDITIIVSGCTNSGKTTIAELIQEFLIKEGFDSTHVEFEPFNNQSRETHTDARIESVKERAKITIKEKRIGIRAREDNKLTGKLL